MIGWATCQLCGDISNPDSIGRRIAAWEDIYGWRPEGIRPGSLYDAIERCRDSQLCRDRFEVGGRRWPLADATKPTTPATVKVVRQVEPEQIAAPVEAEPIDEDEEEAAWLRT